MNFSYKNINELSMLDDTMKSFKEHVEDYILKQTTMYPCSKKELIHDIKEAFGVDLNSWIDRKRIKLWYKYENDELFRIQNYIPLHFKIDKYKEKYPAIYSELLTTLNWLSENYDLCHNNDCLLVDKEFSKIKLLKSRELLNYTIDSLSYITNYPINHPSFHSYHQFFEHLVKNNAQVWHNYDELLNHKFSIKNNLQRNK